MQEHDQPWQWDEAPVWGYYGFQWVSPNTECAQQQWGLWPGLLSILDEELFQGIFLGSEERRGGQLCWEKGDQYWGQQIKPNSIYGNIWLHQMQFIMQSCPFQQMEVAWISMDGNRRSFNRQTNPAGSLLTGTVLSWKTEHRGCPSPFLCQPIQLP